MLIPQIVKSHVDLYSMSPSTGHPTTDTELGMLLPGEEGCTASWKSNAGLWHISTPCALSFGFESTDHCVHQELLLFKRHFPVYKLHIGAQEESALVFLPAFWELGQEDIRVA